MFARETAARHREPSHHTKRVWWLRGATAMVMGYVVASQALMEVSGWSFLAFAFAALLAGLLIAGRRSRIWELKLGRWAWIPAAFITYCLLRCFSGINGAKPFDVLISVVSAFLGGISVALAVQAGVRFRWLVYAQVASNLLQIIIVLSGLGPAPQPGEETFRYAGITGNANALALQLTLGACMIWLLPRKSGLFPCFFAFGAVAFALAATGSRKGVLVAFFFLVLVCIQAANLLPKGRYRHLLISLAIGAPCMLGLFLAPMIHQHAQDLLAIQRTVEYDDSSYQTRTDMIHQGIGLWQQAPVFGNGLDSFRELSGQGTYAHNNYVELLCGIGLVGTLLFYAIHAQVLFHAARAHRLLKHCCWLFILMLLLVDTGYVSYYCKQSIMILMVLMVVTTSRYALKHDHSVPERRAFALKRFKPRPRRFVLGT